MEENLSPDKSKKRPSPLPQWKRHYVLSPLSTLIPPLVKPGFKKHSSSLAILLAEWPEIIGHNYGFRCIPYRLTGSALTLSCSGTTAMELSHISQTIIERINTFYGNNRVKSLRFVQNYSMDPSLSPIVEPSPPSEKKTIPLSQIEAMEEGPLKEALSTLGNALINRRKPAP
ncbi:DUF721 domain-containing protein [Entomobacter blattae]|uniref:Dna[CI] antecedent, DciA n=1 Tax=Entomobacter blattae TaxID=2762277 RepID=A0A7H1NNZ9_9PROT|nr:DUF721 domain-containing protein [Entomobacter blattae]QNT77509.1 Dna[CI] antecedent, DciA [Entomobacter blattae]